MNNKSSYQTNFDTTTTEINPFIRFDKDYVNSNEGLLKIVLIVAAFIVAQFAPNYGKVGFFCFVSMSSFWISLSLFALYAFHVVEKLYNFPWLLAEFAYSLIWCAFYFVSSLLMLIGGGVASVAGMFGFIACALLGFEAKRNYIRYVNKEIAQGESISAPSIP
ncbi:CKLF-like protein MARVEL transmembrane domain-containing protein 4-like protein [Sarcoptes scabiei]|uniref:CKLF-like protein MARVEL transmembrane domain-containing protein 4-like protein n=1 Tax=Sarcoptes scabiei TaxID=52283 RepID=A0A132AIM1_SARSC|nr:CKLF-like protein MARVEL transmembrane domain-containing protein 4-like protein [Sarcoptes scabiei]